MGRNPSVEANGIEIRSTENVVWAKTDSDLKPYPRSRLRRMATTTRL